MRDNKRIEDISSVLCCLREFKQGYKEENGVITIGNIRDLVDKIDFIEECIKKQKDIPVKRKRCFSLFGKWKWIKYCQSCGNTVEYGKYCSECGQRFC